MRCAFESLVPKPETSGMPVTEAPTADDKEKLSQGFRKSTHTTSETRHITVTFLTSSQNVSYLKPKARTTHSCKWNSLQTNRIKY
jgi:hypothetical protein